ncbi:hypothetical protein [Streptomyces abikoensis]|uniref:Uncharacterized protein n=1 Tax=Streptomyces abikoensis TaxID=97398 RepID=A0ABW7TA29_9ACTN
MRPHRDLDRLARLVKERRLLLHPSRAAAAQAVGMSKDTWLRLERGEPVRDITYVKVDEALQWATGSCQAVMGGGDPLPVERSAEEPATVLAKLPAAEIEATIRKSVASAAIATSDDMSAAQIRALAAHVIDDLKGQGLL